MKNYIRDNIENDIKNGVLVEGNKHNKKTIKQCKKLSIITLVLISLLKFSPPLYAAVSNQFTDVAPDQWYSDPIRWAVSQNIVNGYPDGSFKPDAPVTEEHFLIMLARASGIQEEPYANAQSRNMPIYYKLNLPLTRAEAAVYLAANMGYISQTNTKEVAILYLYDLQITKGISSTSMQTIDQYGGDKILTRAQAVTFIQRAVQSPPPLGQTLDEKIKLAYPKEVIFEFDHARQFTEAISNLPAINEGPFSKVEQRFHIDYNIHAVELYESFSKGEDSASILLMRTADKYNIVLFARYLNESTKAALEAVLQLYTSDDEAKQLLNHYVEQRLAEDTAAVAFHSKSNYNITYSKTEIRISN